MHAAAFIIIGSSRRLKAPLRSEETREPDLGELLLDLLGSHLAGAFSSCLLGLEGRELGV